MTGNGVLEGGVTSSRKSYLADGDNLSPRGRTFEDGNPRGGGRAGAGLTEGGGKRRGADSTSPAKRAGSPPLTPKMTSYSSRGAIPVLPPYAFHNIRPVHLHFSKRLSRHRTCTFFGKGRSCTSSKDAVVFVGPWGAKGYSLLQQWHRLHFPVLRIMELRLVFSRVAFR